MQTNVTYFILGKQKSLNFRSETCNREKHSKIRLSRLTSANVTDDKLQMCN